MSTPKPCLLLRDTKHRVWGGHALRNMFAVQDDGTEPIGETWELFDRDDGASGLVGGSTLRELMTQHSSELLGSGVSAGYGGRFPLMLKFLDACQALSVQVHPDDEQARPYGDGGKTEAWVVLDTTEEARICSGFRPGVTHDDLVAALRSTAPGTGPSPVEELLYSFRPKAGDCIYVPAGTVHAIGPGVVLFEVQQNSDLTYRLYDWGRDRPMHIEQGLQVARVEDGSRQHAEVARPLADGGSLLLESPFFRLRRYSLQQSAAMATDDRFFVVTVIAGEGALEWREGDDAGALPLRAGDCALVPACVGQVTLSPTSSLDVILTDPGAC